MPKVEKKSSNDISVYEAPGSKEIIYSQQLFVENFISRLVFVWKNFTYSDPLLVTLFKYTI